MSTTCPPHDVIGWDEPANPCEPARLVCTRCATVLGREPRGIGAGKVAHRGRAEPASQRHGMRTYEQTPPRSARRQR